MVMATTTNERYVKNGALFSEKELIIIKRLLTTNVLK